MRKVKDHVKPSQVMTRRDFLYLSCLTAAGGLAGCAVNPVTGESQFMVISKEQEIKIDQERSPYQFSSDYGSIQNQSMNNYLQTTGLDLARKSHRPDMPYSFRGVNAVYINAYAFPGGSIAVTRGILLELENEAELAALLGHEIAHVNARHTANQMSRGLLINAFLTGAGIAISDEEYAPFVLTLGNIGAGALLAKYSRDNERQADALGMEYMVRSGYNPKGMVGLHEVLLESSKKKPNILETMFATHPMSKERYQTAQDRATSKYNEARAFPMYRERYMDHTVRLREQRKAIELLQDGQEHMNKKEYQLAETDFKSALNRSPEDYAGLVMLGKCLLAQEKHREAEDYLAKATEIYPQEPQAHQFNGIANLTRHDYDSALQEFSFYENKLPKNPNTIFLKGYTLEKMGRRRDAAQEYMEFLRMVNQGEKAKYAYSRLRDWGYVR